MALISIGIYVVLISVFYLSYAHYKYAYVQNVLMLMLLGVALQNLHGWQVFTKAVLWWLSLIHI